jgi:hypothetical protein
MTYNATAPAAITSESIDISHSVTYDMNFREHILVEVFPPCMLTVAHLNSSSICTILASGHNELLHWFHRREFVYHHDGLMLVKWKTLTM